MLQVVSCLLRQFLKLVKLRTRVKVITRVTRTFHFVHLDGVDLYAPSRHGQTNAFLIRVRNVAAVFDIDY